MFALKKASRVEEKMSSEDVDELLLEVVKEKFPGIGMDVFPDAIAFGLDLAHFFQKESGFKASLESLRAHLDEKLTQEGLENYLSES